MEKLNSLKKEAANIGTQLIKLGIMATVTKLAQNTYQTQVNSTIENAAFD